MKYRWKKSMDGWDEESWALYLILDGKKYGCARLTWYEHIEKWNVFIAGYVSDDTVHVEEIDYELLCDAKREVMNYMQVWYVSGALQRMSEHERNSWGETGV